VLRQPRWRAGLCGALLWAAVWRLQRPAGQMWGAEARHALGHIHTPHTHHHCQPPSAPAALPPRLSVRGCTVASPPRTTRRQTGTLPAPRTRQTQVRDWGCEACACASSALGQGVPVPLCRARVWRAGLVRAVALAFVQRRSVRDTRKAQSANDVTVHSMTHAEQAPTCVLRRVRRRAGQRFGGRETRAPTAPPVVRRGAAQWSSAEAAQSAFITACRDGDGATLAAPLAPEGKGVVDIRTCTLTSSTAFRPPVRAATWGAWPSCWR